MFITVIKNARKTSILLCGGNCDSVNRPEFLAIIREVGPQPLPSAPCVRLERCCS